MKASVSTISFAAAAALVAMGAVAVSAPGVAKHAAVAPCYGVNSCKGTSDCKTAKNDCKGMNSCKGMGFKNMTKAACTKAGGSLTAPM